MNCCFLFGDHKEEGGGEANWSDRWMDGWVIEEIYGKMNTHSTNNNNNNDDDPVINNNIWLTTECARNSFLRLLFFLAAGIQISGNACVFHPLFLEHVVVVVVIDIQIKALGNQHSTLFNYMFRVASSDSAEYG